MGISTQGSPRIAQIVRPASGGIRSHVRVLVQGLYTKGFVNELYGPSNLDLSSNIVRHVPIPIQPHLHPIADVTAILRLARLLKGRTDLVHAHGLRGALIGVPAARLAKVPSVFTAHNLVQTLSGIQPYIFDRLCRHSTRIIAVSQAVAETIFSFRGAAGKLAVIPNGIDTERFHVPCSRQRSPQHPVIVAIGRLSPEKGFDVLIAAYAKVVHQIPDAELIIAGSGPEEPKLRAQTQLPVRFLGHITDVLPVLESADVVAIPSRREGQGIVALEAMAAGKPVVASKIGGLIETLAGGASGLLTPVGDVDALAVALIKILSDDVLRKQLGYAGRKRVEQEYTADRMIERTAALYTAIFEERPNTSY